jgi:RHH-type transcriptional regulator, rel operon repressor / antitoxin RelB
MNKTMISARIPENLSDKLEALAVQMKRSKGFILTEALENYVNRETWIAKKIDESIAAADASGERYSQEAVENWFMALGTENELPMPEPDIFVEAKTS